MGMCQTCYLNDYHKRRAKAALKKQNGDSLELISQASLNRINEEIDQD